MPKIIWNFQLEDGRHTLELNHGCCSGKRTIHLDGGLVEKTSGWRNFLFFDMGGEHVFDIGGHRFVVQARTDGRGNFSYRLSVDGVWVEPESFLSARDRLSPFLWFLCILGVIGALMMTALFLLSPPGAPPIEAIPPSLRCVVLPLIVMLCILGVNGVFYKVIIDISHTPTMRRLGWWMLLFVSAVLFVLDVFFWAEGIQGQVGILPALSFGASLWLVMIPVLHVASLIVLAWRPHGMYLVLELLSLASLLLSIFALDTQASGTVAIGLHYSLGAQLSPWLSTGIR